MPVLGVAGNMMRRVDMRKKRPKTKRQKTAKKKRPPKAKPTPKIPEQNRLRHWQLYVLRLEHKKYYVGITAYKDVMHRYKQHAKGKGAAWTRLHPPLEVIETRQLGHMREGEAVKIETQVTIDYMKKYGIRKVRGGTLCMVSQRRIKRHYNALTPVTGKAVPANDPIFNELRWLLNE